MKLYLLSRALYPLSLMLMMSMISGCTHASNQPQVSVQPVADKVILKVAQSLMSPKRTLELQRLIEQFEKEHPTIGIQLLFPPYETADDTILSMLDKREEVDIVEVRDITAHDYASRDFLVNLDNYVEEWNDFTLLSDNARLMARDIGNITYYIPYGLYQVQLYYRKDLFDAKALQVPETWAGLFFVGKQLTRPEIGQYGYAFRGGRGAASTLTSIIQDYNGSNVSVAESMFNVDGTTIFKGEHAREALELYRKIYVETSHPSSIDWGFNEQVEAFVSGKAGMLIQDSDVIPLIKDKLKDSQWATAPLPAGPEGVSHYIVGAAGWGIAKQSEHPEEAWTFISYLSTLDNNRSFADAAGVISIYNKPLSEEKFSIGPYAPYTLMANDPLHFQGVKRPSHYAGYSEYLNMGTVLGRKYLQESLSTDGLLDQFDAFWMEQRKQLSD